MKIVLLICCLAFAQTVTVDLAKLPQQVQSEVIKANQANQAVSVDQFQKYAEIGKAIGLAFKEVCQVLNVEVNAFIKTPAGKITVGMIAWKVLGEDFVHLFGGLGMAIALAIIGFIMLKTWFGHKKEWVFKDGKKTEEFKYKKKAFEQSDSELGGIIVIGLAFAVSFLTAVVTIVNF